MQFSVRAVEDALAAEPITSSFVRRGEGWRGIDDVGMSRSIRLRVAVLLRSIAAFRSVRGQQRWRASANRAGQAMPEMHQLEHAGPVDAGDVDAGHAAGSTRTESAGRTARTLLFADCAAGAGCPATEPADGSRCRAAWPG